MIQTINDKIKTELETLKGTNKPFANIYDYHTIENTGYPFASFELTELSWDIRDTCNNMRTLTFELYIIQEFESITRQEAKDIIYKAMDDVIDLFDNNYTLDWVVELIQPIGWTVIPFNVANWPALVGSIQLQVRYNHFIW